MNLEDLKRHIDSLVRTMPEWARSTQPSNILCLAYHGLGIRHANDHLATGEPIRIPLSSITLDISLLLDYIRNKQLQLEEQAHYSKFDVLDRRSRAGFDGPGTPDA